MSDHPHNFAYLIVGAGLAGCLLAWRLQQAGQRFLLIGSTTLPSAFDVAAGVINPITGRWMTKSWNFDQLQPQAVACYRALEQQFSIRIYHPIPARRFCQNAEDVKRVGRRLRNPRYQNVLPSFFAVGEAASEFKDRHGSFSIQQAAYVDLPQTVHTLRAFFARQGCLRDEVFHHAQLQRTPTGWRYQNLRAHKVIFCEGAAARNNPWFKKLALKPAKGETLLCHSPTLQLPQRLYHHKKWLLPYPDGSFRIGASYDENDLSEAPTAAQKQALLTAAHAVLKTQHSLEVRKHMAGIRPVSHDSRPILGAHPSLAGLYLLNGLGSKGASTAPAMTAQLAQHLLQQTPIPPEVDLARFALSDA